MSTRKTRPVRSQAGLAVLLVSLPWVISPTTGLRGEDVWSPGHDLAAWEQIGALQRYPVLTARMPDIVEPASKSDEPLVRAAACLAIGRSADEKYLPLLTPVLRDEVPFVRRCALWALLQINSPRIKKPLLEVLGSWEEERIELSDGLCYLTLNQYGLPDRLKWLPLDKRRAWLAEFDARAWDVRFDNPNHGFFGSEGGKAFLGTDRPELNAGDPVRLRLRISRKGGDQRWTFDPEELRWWWEEIDGRAQRVHPRGPDVRPSSRGDSTTKPGRSVLTVEPHETAEVEWTVSTEKLLLRPGIYLFGSECVEAPLLLRVRRSPEMEEQIPELIHSLPDGKAVRTLGELRAAAAVPALIELFRMNAGGNNFAVADALAQIGDPAAIPVLLKHPYMAHVDVGGDTTNALKSFGEAAYAAYEAQILAWQEALRARELRPLEMSLRLSGPHGSPAVHRAQREIVATLSRAYAKDKYAEKAVLSAAIQAIAAQDPKDATDLIWATRGQPDVFRYVLREADSQLVSRREGGSGDPAAAHAMVVDLWNRAKAQPPDEGAVTDALRGTAASRAPELLLEEDAPVASAYEAAQLIRFAHRRAEAQPEVIGRVTAYLARDASPAIELSLGLLHFRRKEYDACEALLRGCLQSEDATDSEQVNAHYYLGESLAARDRLAEATTELRAALAAFKPGHSLYLGLGDRWLTKEGIEQRLGILASMIRLRPVRWDYHEMDARVCQNGYVELADGCCFYLDDLQKLRRWDPRSRSGASFGIMANPVREFIPVDRDRVFVLFVDGTSALYREGREEALWRGPSAVGYESRLSASPQAITVTNDAGTLHALDPDTGRELWRQKIDVQHRRPPTQRTWRGLVRQVAGSLLLRYRSDTPMRFALLALNSGEIKWERDLPFHVTAVEATDDLVVLANPRNVAGVSTRDGRIVWAVSIDAPRSRSAAETALAVQPDGELALLAVRDHLWAIDTGSGDVRWKWHWQPRPESGKRRDDLCGPYSQLIAAEDGVFWVIPWTADTRTANNRTDVVRLSDARNVLLHVTSPLSGAPTSVLERIAFEREGVLFVRHGSTWERWQMNRAVSD